MTGEDGTINQITDQSDPELAEFLRQKVQNKKVEINFNDLVDSIRCIKVSPDGRHLASGDEVGNIRVHSLETNDLTE